MFEIIDQNPQEAIIKVIGVGGCGGNAVEHMINRGVGVVAGAGLGRSSGSGPLRPTQS